MALGFGTRQKTTGPKRWFSDIWAIKTHESRSVRDSCCGLPSLLAATWRGAYQRRRRPRGRNGSPPRRTAGARRRRGARKGSPPRRRGGGLRRTGGGRRPPPAPGLPTRPRPGARPLPGMRPRPPPRRRRCTSVAPSAGTSASAGKGMACAPFVFSTAGTAARTDRPSSDRKNDRRLIFSLMFPFLSSIET